MSRPIQGRWRLSLRTYTSTNRKRDTHWQCTYDILAVSPVHSNDSDPGQSFDGQLHGIAPMNQEGLEWQVAVFCQNEQSRIAACLASIQAAIGPRRSLITLIINGSTDNSEAAARAAIPGISTPVQIFVISCADKSNAINQFLMIDICVPMRTCIFCRCLHYHQPDAFTAMVARLGNSPNAVAASGIASNGRSEPQSTRQTVEVGGVLKGQLYSLRPDFIRRMVAGGIRLPIGLYRGDGLLGSMAAHDLDAIGQPWVNGRLIGVSEATFEIDPLSPLRLRDLRRQFRRKVRQMRGKLENAAIKQVIYSGGYAALPAFADDMIRDFLAKNPIPAVSLPDVLYGPGASESSGCRAAQ